MKVALAHDHLNQIGGAEMVLDELHQLYPSAPIFTVAADHGAMAGLIDNWDVRTSFIEQLPGAQKFFKWYLWLMPVAIEQLNLAEFDLVISSASALIKGVLTSQHTRHICYCHTPTRYLWSDTVQYIDELPQPKIVKMLLPILLTKLRQWDYLAAQRVDTYVANSKFVQQRIAKYYRRDSQIIYPPVAVESFSLAEPEDYFLVVSRLRPYKRVDLAIKAFNKLGMPLKIIGSGEQHDELKALAKPNIEFLGQLSDEEKGYYMARCRALIHPQEEDFGITAVEAQASGRPVIAYARGGARESIIDDVTGKFFTEQSWEALADAVIRFRYQSFDSEQIKKHAQKFSRARFVEEWGELVSKVMSR